MTGPFWANSHEASSPVTVPAGIAESAETDMTAALVLPEALQVSSGESFGRIELEREPVEPWIAMALGRVLAGPWAASSSQVVVLAADVGNAVGHDAAALVEPAAAAFGVQR